MRDAKLKKNNRRHSLSFYLYLITALVTVGVTVLFGITNTYSISAMRQQTNVITQVTLSMYSDYIENSFKNAESFLSGFGYNDEDLVSLGSEDTLTRYIAVSREHTKLKEAIPSHSWIDGFFFYNPASNVYACATQNRISDTESIVFRDKIKKDISGGELTLDKLGSWMSYSAGGRYYLLRMIRHRGTYVGAWINVDNLLSTLNDSSRHSGVSYLYQAHGRALSVQANERFDFDPSDAATGYQMVDGGQKYLAISHSLLSGQYYLVTMIPDSDIQTRLSGQYRIVVVAAVLLLALCLVMYAALRSLFVLPMHRLSLAIRKIRDGHLETRIVEPVPVAEFQEVNDSFNEMSAEIQRLTISVYEQRLKRLRIHQEYLKQQITPHFYINCLNTIYSLAGLGKNDLVRELSKELSQHLRYTMSSKPTVELHEELDHVRNYAAMTSLRYPNTLHCTIDCSEAVQNTVLPPLSLQCFVENTVKHELVMGEPIEIHISADEFWQGSERKVHLCLWDTGRGYAPDVLAHMGEIAVCDPDEFVETDGHHIGLVNMIQRFQMVFDNQAQIRFSNREGAGAQCDILIPFRTQLEGKDDE